MYHSCKKVQTLVLAPKSDNDVSQPLQLGSGSAQDKVKIPSKAGNSQMITNPLRVETDSNGFSVSKRISALVG